MCIRPWQGRLIHFEEKLPGANVVGSQPIGIYRLRHTGKVSKMGQNVPDWAIAP